MRRRLSVSEAHFGRPDAERREQHGQGLEQSRAGVGGIVRATGSAHRTGLAIDANVGAAPGFGPDSTDDANRLFISKTPAYRWMIRRARAFGFVNYAFEPWHWEWTGEAP